MRICATNGIIKEANLNLNYSEEAMKTVKSYTFMTDRFMTMAFNIPVAQHVLSVIMDTNLVVKSVKQQPIEDNFFSKSCRFDVLAEDDTGKSTILRCRIQTRERIQKEHAIIANSWTSSSSKKARRMLITRNRM